MKNKLKQKYLQTNRINKLILTLYHSVFISYGKYIYAFSN